MTNHQKVIAIVAAVNVGLMLLFPPVLDSPLQRGALPTFGGFVPFFALGAGQRVFREMLTLQILFVAANALTGWLAAAGGGRAGGRRWSAIALFAAANLAVILLFPPFETYGSVLRHAVPTFDGFYFVLGERSRRALFASLLYLEILLVAINALVIGLLFGALGPERPAQPGDILRLAGDMPREEVMKLSEALRRLAGGVRSGSRPSEEAIDRRRGNDPNYRGSDRRLGRERRKHPR